MIEHDTTQHGRDTELPESQKALRRLNCILVEVQLHAGTPAYPTSAATLAEELLAQSHFLIPAVARLAPVLPPEEAMSEIVPDLLARIAQGTFHWFTLRYLKTAAAIRARQLRREIEPHLSLQDESFAEPTTSAVDEAPGEFTEQEVRRIYRRFLRGLNAEQRHLLRLSRREGRQLEDQGPCHRQGWQKKVAGSLKRPPCWVTRHLDDLFQKLAMQLGRSDLKHRKRRNRSPGEEG